MNKNNNQAGFGMIGGITALVVVIGIASATMLDSMSRATKASSAVSNRGTTMAVLQQAANTLSRESTLTHNGVSRPIAAEAGQGPAGGGKLPSSMGGFTDGYGNPLGLCSFHNGSETPGAPAGTIALNSGIALRESMPNAPAFVVVSAGKNGVFNLNCNRIYAAMTNDGTTYDALKPATEIQTLAQDDIFVASDITDAANRQSQNMINLVNGGTLCDPITQKLIYVNDGEGAEFRCVNETDPTVSANSIGTAGGVDILKHDITTTDNEKNFQIRKLQAGNNIVLSLNNDSIRIDSTGGAGQFANVGGAAEVYKGLFGGTHQFRTLIGTGGTTVNVNGDRIEISSVPGGGGGGVTGGQNVGNGTANVFRALSGQTMEFGKLRSADTNKLTISNDADGAVVFNPVLVGAEGVNGLNVTQQQPPNALPDNVSGAVTNPTNPEKANLFVGKESPNSTQLRFRQLKEGNGIEFHVDTDGSLVIGSSGSGAGEIDPVFVATRPSAACTQTQKITWTGSAFVCATDLNGGGGGSITVAHSGTGIQLAPESGATGTLTLKRLNAASGSGLTISENGGSIIVGNPAFTVNGGSVGVGGNPDTNYRFSIPGGGGLSVFGSNARINVWGSGTNVIGLNNNGTITATGAIYSGNAAQGYAQMWLGDGAARFQNSLAPQYAIAHNSNGYLAFNVPQDQSINFKINNGNSIMSVDANGLFLRSRFNLINPASAQHHMIIAPQDLYSGIEHVETQDPYSNNNSMNTNNLFAFWNPNLNRHVRIGVEKVYAYDGIATKHNGLDVNFFNYGGNTFVRGMRIYARNAPAGNNDPNGNFHIDLKRDYVSLFHPENTIALRTHNSWADLNVGNVRINGDLTVTGSINGSGGGGAFQGVFLGSEVVNDLSRNDAGGNGIYNQFQSVNMPARPADATMLRVTAQCRGGAKNGKPADLAGKVVMLNSGGTPIIEYVACRAYYSPERDGTMGVGTGGNDVEPQTLMYPIPAATANIVIESKIYSAKWTGNVKVKATYMK